MPTRLLEELLAGLVVAERSSYIKLQLRRLLSGAIVVAWLIIMAAISVSAMVVGALYAGYTALLYHGMAPFDAMLVVLAVFAAITALFILLASLRLYRLRSTSAKLWRQSLSGRMNEAMDAFIDGLTAEV